MNLKAIAKQCIPPIIFEYSNQLRAKVNACEWQYLPKGWPDSTNSEIKGWNVETVARVQKTKWDGLVKPIRNASLPGDTRLQHTLLAFAYVLTLTARMKPRISLLDWGGGLGFYSVLGEALIPGIEIDYHCLETPTVCQAGREVLPEANFYDNEADCLQRKYDLVLASGVLQCFQDWKRVAQRLAEAFQSYLFITRLPIVQQASSFVVLQRPCQHGYETEYPNWFLNRQEFLEVMNSAGVQLTREFLLSEKPNVCAAPEQCEYRGYLYSRENAS